MHIELCDGLYIISLSLQLAGALILVNFLFHKGKRKNILKEMIYNAPGFDEGEETENGRLFELDVLNVRNYASNTYKNIIAGVYITLGYLLSVFGNINIENRLGICFCIVTASMLLLIAGNIMARVLANKVFPDNCSVILSECGEVEEISE